MPYFQTKIFKVTKMINWPLFFSKYNCNYKISYHDFLLDDERALADQIDNLKEDLLQVSLNENLLLDIGWQPSFNINGRFIIQVIEHYDWDSPIQRVETNSIQDLLFQLDDMLKTFSSNTTSTAV